MGHHTIRQMGLEWTEPPMTETPDLPERSYGCTFGCGNPYDYILIDVRSGETLMLCLPCHLKVAADMVEMVTDPDSAVPYTVTPAGEAILSEGAPGPRPRRGRRNAPATADDPDLITSYEELITEDDLPDEFR
jgi:hypothetical protein